MFFARPSLLLGRPEDGRLVETWASVLLAPASRWLPRSVRPIEVRVVAAAMVDAALGSADGRASFVLSNAAMHQGESAQR